MFISFEGTEGVGKSTLVTSLATWLESQGESVVLTREPGGTPLAEELRALVLHEDMCADTELLLMFAARSQHIHEVIQPALDAGKWVLCDRFVDASFAYQGAGRGIAQSKIQGLQDAFVKTLPALTFWLDLPVHVGLARAAQRDETDRFEQEKHTFFEKIHAGYAQRFAADPQRFVRIDASQDAQTVLSVCKGMIQSHLRV